MPPEKIFHLPAVSLDQPPPKEDWGTKVAQFRGVCYELFLGESFIGSESPKGFPLRAKCVIRSDGKGNHTVILDLGDAPAKKEVPAVPRSSGKKVA